MGDEIDWKIVTHMYVSMYVNMSRAIKIKTEHGRVVEVMHLLKRGVIPLSMVVFVVVGLARQDKM